MDPLLQPSMSRFCLFPIKYHKAWEMYLQQVASFWTVSEVDLSNDKVDLDTLSFAERDFIMKTLAFFAASDGIVNENLVANFATEVQIPEIRQFYGFQIGMETIHAHMYAAMIDSYEPDPVKRDALFKGVETVDSIRGKAEWAMRWFDNSRPFAERIVAFACVEGIFFSASFCAIYYFKKRGKMPGLTFSNELIARDEGLHRDFACHVYSLLQTTLSTAVITDIVSSAVNKELDFVHEALPVEIIGMNAQMMSEYVKFVADHLVVSLGHDKIFGASNPFEWMTLISLSGKTNFFEKRVSEYQKANVRSDNPMSDRRFITNADF